MSSLKKQTIPWPKEFKYLKPYYSQSEKGPFGLFRHYYHFGDTKEDSISFLKKQRPPFLIGISSLFTPYYRETLKIAEICKEVFPQIPIVIGGGHASKHAEQFLKSESDGIALCDYIIQGEGEKPLLRLIADFLANKKNLPKIYSSSQKEKKTSSKTTPSFFLPSYKSIDDLSLYKYKGHQIIFIQTTRSCPFQCDFCSIHQVFGSTFRPFPTSFVLKQIKKGLALGGQQFDIQDDNFTFIKQHAIELLEGIKNLNVPITLSAMNGLSYLSLDKDILKLMKESGFKELNLACVSQSKHLKERINRPSDDHQLEQIILEAKQLHFDIQVSFIIGLPGQSLEEVADTIRHLSSLPVRLQASPFYLTPGTKIEKKLKLDSGIKKASKKYDPFLSARLTAMDIETPEISRDDTYTFLKICRLINHIKTQAYSIEEINPLVEKWLRSAFNNELSESQASNFPPKKLMEYLFSSPVTVQTINNSFHRIWINI